eukprot:2566317-Prymnesium_polylepis.2
MMPCAAFLSFLVALYLRSWSLAPVRAWSVAPPVIQGCFITCAREQATSRAEQAARPGWRPSGRPHQERLRFRLTHKSAPKVAAPHWVVAMGPGKRRVWRRHTG